MNDLHSAVASHSAAQDSAAEASSGRQCVPNVLKVWLSKAGDTSQKPLSQPPHSCVLPWESVIIE